MNKSFVKFLTDFGPLLIFFFYYYNSDKDLKVAIPPFIIATIIALIIVWLLEKKIPIILRLLDSKLHYKLLFHSDLYFGEAYADGTIKIENGSLTDFLDLALKNIGRNELNYFSKLLN